jgi:hypothetical protein
LPLRRSAFSNSASGEHQTEFRKICFPNFLTTKKPSES